MKITIHDPQMPDGEEIGIAGLCAVPNGESVEVDAEDIKLWEENTGTKFEDSIKNNPFITTGSEKPSAKLKRLQNKQDDDRELTEPEQLLHAQEEGGELNA